MSTGKTEWTGVSGDAALHARPHCEKCYFGVCANKEHQQRVVHNRSHSRRVAGTTILKRSPKEESKLATNELSINYLLTN